MAGETARERVTVYWSRQAIVVALRAWHERYGTIPTLHGWEVPPGDEYPPASIVQRRFGSWNKGLQAAGLTPREATRKPLRVPQPQVKFEGLLPRALHTAASVEAERRGVSLTELVRLALEDVVGVVDA